MTEVVTHRETVYPNEIGRMVQEDWSTGKPPAPPFKQGVSQCSAIKTECDMQVKTQV